ncbi:MAG: BrnA antitoxin family protein [Anaerolineae bacterium]|nr:BrnA antitoxin family protein [Anaerolineae bacterium]MCI0608212.1 BrnA antitoxin family protein [Anaerolineae bacterium]
MSTISLRLPESLHKAARNLAREENISINQLITLALAEKVSALAAEDYIQKRGARANRKKFLKALSKVPHSEPVEFDRLPAISKKATTRKAS